MDSAEELQVLVFVPGRSQHLLPSAWEGRSSSRSSWGSSGSKILNGHPLSPPGLASVEKSSRLSVGNSGHRRVEGVLGGRQTQVLPVFTQELTLMSEV